MMLATPKFWLEQPPVYEDHIHEPKIWLKKTFDVTEAGAAICVFDNDVECFDEAFNVDIIQPGSSATVFTSEVATWQIASQVRLLFKGAQQ